MEPVDHDADRHGLAHAILGERLGQEEQAVKAQILGLGQCFRRRNHRVVTRERPQMEHPQGHARLRSHLGHQAVVVLAHCRIDRECIDRRSAELAPGDHGNCSHALAPQPVRDGAGDTAVVGEDEPRARPGVTGNGASDTPPPGRRVEPLRDVCPLRQGVRP